MLLIEGNCHCLMEKCISTASAFGPVLFSAFDPERSLAADGSNA